MAEEHLQESNGETKKLKPGFSLERLIGKLKTTPAPVSLIDGSGESQALANGTSQPGIEREKKSRRKGHPVSYVAATAEYEAGELDDSLTIEGDLAVADLEENPFSNSMSKLESLKSDSTISSTSAPKHCVQPSEKSKASVPSGQEEIPEGTVVVNPEAPTVEEENNVPKIQPEFAGSELALCNSGQTRLNSNETYQCTTCKDPLYLKESHNIRQHPLLKVVVCKSCSTFYQSGEFTKDEDGYDNQCAWCGQGGNLLICDFCTKAFCKRCIRNNFKRDMLKRIESCSQWKCLVCDPKPLATHVLRSMQLQKLVIQHSESQKLSSRSAQSRDACKRNSGKVTAARNPTPVSTLQSGTSSTQASHTVSKTSTPASTTSTTSAAICESRVYINVPAHSNIGGKDKALLSVNLSTVAAQYISAQNIRCDQLFLEALVQEHNNFSKALQEAKQVLLQAHNKYTVLASRSTNSQAEAAAKTLYRQTCDKLGAAMKTKIVSNVTNMIKLVSPAAKSAAPKAASAQPPRIVAAPSAASSAATLLSTKLASTFTPAQQISLPSQTTAAPTNQSNALSGSSVQQASENREFIDINELPNSAENHKEVIDLCSDDEDDNSVTLPPPPEAKNLPIVVSKAPALRPKVAPCTLKSSESFDVGAHVPFSPTSVDPANSSSQPKSSSIATSEQLDFSTTVDNASKASEGTKISAEQKELGSGTNFSHTQQPVPLEFSSDDDDLVGVTPRRLALSEVDKAADKGTADTSNVEADTIEEVAGVETMEVDSEISLQPQKSQHLSEGTTHGVETEENSKNSSEPKAGPSGLSRRALRRLIKEQEDEEKQGETNTTEEPVQKTFQCKELISSSSDEEKTVAEPVKKTFQSKEFISSSSDEETANNQTDMPIDENSLLSRSQAAEGDIPCERKTSLECDKTSTTSNSNLVQYDSDGLSDESVSINSSTPPCSSLTVAKTQDHSVAEKEKHDSPLTKIGHKRKRHQANGSDSDHTERTRHSLKRPAKSTSDTASSIRESSTVVSDLSGGDNTIRALKNDVTTDIEGSGALSSGLGNNMEPASEESQTETSSKFNASHVPAGVDSLGDNTDGQVRRRCKQGTARDPTSSEKAVEIFTLSKDKSVRDSDAAESNSSADHERVARASRRSKKVVSLARDEDQSDQNSDKKLKKKSPKSCAVVEDSDSSENDDGGDLHSPLMAAEFESDKNEAKEPTTESKQRLPSGSPAVVMNDEDILLGDISTVGEVQDEEALLGDSETETVTKHASESAKMSGNGEGALTDMLENTKALSELKDVLLSSSDLDSDPPPRVFLKRQAKMPIKDKKKRVKAKSKHRTAADRQEQQMLNLKPAQRRYMRQRASGLRITLCEKKEPQLQKLLADIESKSVLEMDTEGKHSMRTQVALDKLDLGDKDVIKKLLNDYLSTKKPKRSIAGLEEDSAADSDLEKEIERLAKFQVMLKKAGSKSAKKSREKGKKLRAKDNDESSKRRRRQIVDSAESLSDINSRQSGNDSSAESSGSKSDSNRSDIIIIPNQDQLDNEDAMKALLQQMADSDSEGNSLSSVNSAESDDSDRDAKKKDGGKRASRKGRKVHPLEQAGLGEKSGGQRRLRSTDSSSESESEDGDVSSDSDIIPRGKKRRFRRSASDGSGSSSDSEMNRKLSNRDNKLKKKGKRRRVVKRSSSSSSESGSSGSDSDVNMTPSKGRHKIRKLLDDDKLKDTTKSAHRLEMERRKRIEEKQKKYNEGLLSNEAPATLTTQRQLILEKDDDDNIVVEVDPQLVKKLKPHQIDAVRFLWDCVCETVVRSNKTGGDGCILAHCMGLGKTLSLITFLHTLMTHEDKLNLRRMLVIAPVNTVLNWKDEVEKWTSNLEIDMDVDELQSSKKNTDRIYRLKRWHNTGGIMVMGYDLYRNLSCGKTIKKQDLRNKFQQYLAKPGPDVVVCDEGHLLKNAKSGVRKAVMEIHSRRRIVLTGTPLQNNLKEYHCMVDFVKPSLLGTAAEFNNRFVAPITNGQYEDSTPFDVKLMKKRAHVLHEMLAGCVQRRDYAELTKFLPPKHEYILSVKLTELQIQLYQFYLEKIRADGKLGVKGKLFLDFQNLSRVWSHPMALELHKKKKEQKDDFIDDETSEDTPSSSDDGSDILVQDSDGGRDVWKPSKKKNKMKTAVEELKAEDGSTRANSGACSPNIEYLWWKDQVKDVKMNDISLGYKFVLLLEVLKKCDEIGDRVLLFSQGILTLDLIEDFLEMIHNSDDEVTKALYGCVDWKKGVNYFRIDGTVDAAQRRRACSIFNRPNNHSARLFLISTRAGGMGINLIGANRVIIFDASWNPSYDVQAIFRAYRFGQKKPLYVYRFLAQGTMEERIYERQVAKLSLSERVVDERQIDRHFTANDLNELYRFKLADDEPNEIPALPKDLLLADLLETHGHLIRKVREHDSLLENREEEKLSAEERKAAWQEYQQEKERVNLPPPTLPPNPLSVTTSAGLTNNTLSNSGAALSTVLLNDLEKFKLLENLKRRFPSTTGEHLRRMFEAQCYEINSRRLREHQSARGNPPLNASQMHMLQSHLQQQQHQQQQQQQQYWGQRHAISQNQQQHSMHPDQQRNFRM